jgi:hypothetical protein
VVQAAAVRVVVVLVQEMLRLALLTQVVAVVAELFLRQLQMVTEVTAAPV